MTGSLRRSLLLGPFIAYCRFRVSVIEFDNGQVDVVLQRNFPWWAGFTGVAKVRAWALEHGDDPDLRIALCGYAGEHEMPKTWTEHAWKGARGYVAEGNTNRELERIWFSPHCLPIEQQRELFERTA